VTVVIWLWLAFAVQAWFVHSYRIPSDSMAPTVAVGQRVLVDQLTDSWSTGSRSSTTTWS